MMQTKRWFAPVPLALAAAGLTACASLFGGESVKIRPINNMSGLTTVGRDPLYESAVTAINVRDYARALNYLQEAKAKDPSNVKVLNALGVVYDKLGRFDLSARYYAQARAVDPQSTIVAANMGYSRVLQGLQGVDEHSAVAALEASGGKSSPTEHPAATPSSAAAMIAHAAAEGNRPIIAASSSPSIAPDVTSAPGVKSVVAPVVVVSIPANVVAPAVTVVEKRPAVLPVHTASVAPVARPAEKQTVATIAPAAARPETKGEVVTAPNSSANLVQAVPVAAKLAVVLPVSSASIAPVARPAEKQTVAVISPVVAKPEAKGGVVTAPNPPANLVQAMPVTVKAVPVSSTSVAPVARPAEKQTVAVIAPAVAKPEAKGEAVTAPNPPANLVQAVPVTLKSAVALPVHTASVGLVARPAEEQTVAITPPVAKPETKGEAVTAPNPPTGLMRALSVAVKPAVVQPARSVSAAPVAQSEKGHAIAISAKSIVKPAKPMTARPIAAPAAPAAVRTAVGPAAPITRAPSLPASKKILMVGKPVKILNASGRPGGAGSVSYRLAALGWSVRQSDWRIQPATTLYYPSKNIVAARAMLRTIPFPARFMPDNNDSSAMRLVIGRDYLSWKPKNARLAALWKKGSVFASLQKPLTRGAR